jgi:sister chromatid cohesion protein DCC1
MDEQETSIAYQHKFKDPLLSKSSFIIDSGSTFYEVIPARPAFDNLSLAVYKGPDHDARQSLELIGFEELLKETRASERELKEYLFSIHCIELNEKMRKLDIEYLGYVLEFLLLTAEEQGLSLDKLDTRQLVQGLEDSGIPLPVAEHVLAFHSITGYGDVVQLDEFKTCQTLGHKILAQDLQMECQIFMQNWKKACPDTMQIDLSQLNGLYLIDEDSMHVTIQYFPKERLSSNVKVRFQELFKVRPKWNREDMLPFLLDLAPTIKELNPIILKYTRESKQGNVSFLTAKYAQF